VKQKDFKRKKRKPKHKQHKEGEKAMKQTISVNDFRDAFIKYGRNDNFSYDGLGALFDYLEGYEDNRGEEMELDVVALCCDYIEYKNAFEAAESCNFEFDDSELDLDEGEDDGGDFETEKEEQALEYLYENTLVIELEGGGVIIQDF